MRRHRHIRNGYRAGNVKKTRKMIVTRLLFTVICAAVIFLFSVLLGRHLSSKVDVSGASTDNGTASDTAEVETTPQFSGGVPITDPEAYKREICAADIDITAVDVDTLRDMIDGLSDIYNAVSVRLNNTEGTLVYASPALMEYARLDSSRADNRVTLETTATTKASADEPTDVSDEDEKSNGEKDEKNTVAPTETECDVLENLKVLIEAAHEKSLYVVATFSADEYALSTDVSLVGRKRLDAVLAGELASFGCDEILVTDLFDGDSVLPAETLEAIIAYLACLREYTDNVRLGVNFSDGVYLIPQNASMIKTLSEYADFLSISIETDDDDPHRAYSSVYDNCYSLKGNFSMYNLRALILSEDESTSSAIYASLCALSAESFQFTCYVSSPSYTVGKDDTQVTESDNGIANENASRSEDYENVEN